VEDARNPDSLLGSAVVVGAGNLPGFAVIPAVGAITVSDGEAVSRFIEFRGTYALWQGEEGEDFSTVFGIEEDDGAVFAEGGQAAGAVFVEADDAGRTGDGMTNVLEGGGLKGATEAVAAGGDSEELELMKYAPVLAAIMRAAAMVMSFRQRFGVAAVFSPVRIHSRSLPKFLTFW